MRIVQKQLLVLNRNLQPEIFTGEHLKTHSGIPHQINNSKGWYQNVPFGGGVLKPRYKFEGLKKHVANDLNFVQDVVAIVKRFKLCCRRFQRIQ